MNFISSTQNTTLLHYQLYLPFTLATAPKEKQKENKIKIKTIKKRRKKIAVEAVVCHGVSHSIPYCSKQVYLQMFIAMSHWSGLRPLASAILSILDLYEKSSKIRC